MKAKNTETMSVQYNKFDWDDFYSEYNAKIIESLLDKEEAPLRDIIKIFLGEPVINFDDFLIEVITHHSYLVKNALLIVLNYRTCQLSGLFIRAYMYTLHRLLTMLNMYFTIDPENNSTMANTDKLMSAMIYASLLPDKIIRLPRQTLENSHTQDSQIVPNYYEKEFSCIPNNLNDG